MITEWLKIKSAAKYTDLSVRTFRNFLNNGLRHIKLPSGTILIKREWLDNFLKLYEVNINKVDEIVDNIIEDLK